jgi:hypothetical protein
MAARTPGQGVHGHNVRRFGFGWRRRLGDLLAKLFRQILIFKSCHQHFFKPKESARGWRNFSAARAA